MGKMGKNSGNSLSATQLAGLFVVVLLVFGLTIWATTKASVSQTTVAGKFSYAGQNVEHEIDSTNIYTGAAVDPTFYVYETQPENWGNCRVDPESGYTDTGTSSSGTYTVETYPGTYYIRGDLSGYYCEYFTIEIPATGDVALSDYNQAPGSTKNKQVDVDTWTISNVDLGIAANASTDTTFTVSTSKTCDDNEGFYLDEVKFQEDATYAFATDADGDSIYDEGINKLEVTVSYGGNSKSYVPFDVAAGIDDFGGDSVATLDYDLFIPEEGTLTIQFKVTCDAVLTATGDADEMCGNGEDFLDSIILVDKEGNTVTFDLSG